jgi:hypothetical protein
MVELGIFLVCELVPLKRLLSKQLRMMYITAHNQRLTPVLWMDNCLDH